MRRKLRILCLHSFRTSGEILREQVRLAGWEETLGDLVEFHVMDAPHPASGPVPPDVLAFFPDVPYREWWNAPCGVWKPDVYAPTRTRPGERR